MGNEASLEGGEGLAELPEGVAAAGAPEGGLPPGAPSQGAIPAGVEADLSQLSEEERRQIAAVMSRAQRGLPKGNLAGAGSAEPPPSPRHAQLDSSPHPRQPGKPPDPLPQTLSKSRTVDTLKTEQRVPGRSPSSTSLRQSKSRTDFKEDQKPSMMPSFLSDANPFGAVTSVVNKFNPFDLISDSDTAQEEAAKKQKPIQKEQDKPEQQKGPIKQPAQQPSPKPTGSQQGTVKPTPQKTGPSKQVQQQQQPGVPKQALKPGPSQPTGPQSEEAKQQGPPKSQSQQPESTKPIQQQSPAKPSPQQPGAAKASSQQLDAAKTSSPAPGPTKPAAQQGIQPGKQLSQQPGGPAKAAPQSAGPSKQSSQQSGGPAKPAPQPGGPVKQPLQQPGGSAKPSVQQARPTEQPQQQAGPTKPTDKQPGPSQKQRAASSQQASQPGGPAPKKTFCPLCTTTELLLHTPEKANYNTCTQCQTVVCSLCGFNPNPHITEIKEWLCLNCQMQRALGGDVTSGHGPGPQPSVSKQKIPAPTSATKPPSQPQQPTQKKDVPLKSDVTPVPEYKKPPTQTKHLPSSSPAKSKPSDAELQPTESTPKSDEAKPSVVEDKQKQSSIQKPTSNIGPTPLDTKKDSPGLKPALAQQKVVHSQKSEAVKSSQDTPTPLDAKSAPLDAKTSPQVSRQKSDPKLVSQPGPGLDTKAQKQVEQVDLKEDPKKVQPPMNPKPDAKQQIPKGQQATVGPKPSQAQPPAQIQQPQKTPEQSRRFSLNVGGITDAPKPQPTTPQETVTGKLFGFGASIFSQASNLISTTGQPGAQPQGPPSGSPSRHTPPPAQPPVSQKDVRQSQPPPKATPMKKETKPLMAEKPEPPKAEGISTVRETDAEKKPLPAKDTKSPAVKAKQSSDPPEMARPSLPTSACPLCKIELNVGSKAPPNYNTCTECKNIVCNLCGFNPMPHITEVGKAFFGINIFREPLLCK
ncbi:protein piccolo-like [Elgaria multicarinata webbii]|uniref:protein piccolo-like n=1 Tax=Elgaria multicarinata webbii TaxID=159646 RepID=UPI002FCCDF6A